MFKLRLFAPAIAGWFVLAASPSGAAVISEDFSANPLQRGWRVFGDTNLFRWNATNQNLEVTWDSSRPNSYFHHPLGTILDRNDDFSLAFDLRLDDAEVVGYFELAIGFANHQKATQPGFSRAIANSPDLVEFDHFPDGGWGATTSPAFVSSDLEFAPTKFAPYSIGLPLNQVIHVAMDYTASNQTLVTILTTNGALLAHLLDVKLDDPGNSQFAADSDFRVDMVSINSYSDAGQDPQWGISTILAHGTVDNLLVTVPPPPVQNLTGALSNSLWQAQFISRSNWLYTLERSTDLQTWADVPPAVAGNATSLFLDDTNPPAERAFYRVRANRP
jgi:hypothetical protein